MVLNVYEVKNCFDVKNKKKYFSVGMSKRSKKFLIS